MHTDPKSVRIQSSCQDLFVLLGSAGVKAVGKLLMKLTPGSVCNPINLRILLQSLLQCVSEVRLQTKKIFCLP